MTTATFRLAAMDCVADEQLVRLRLGDLDGVDTVGTDLSDRTVTIRHHADPTALQDALDALNLGTVQLTETTEMDDPGIADQTVNEGRVLTIALVINAGFFITEFAAGLIGRSMGLLADSLDMLADASVYALSLIAVGRSTVYKKRLAAGSGYLQLGLALVGLIAVTRRFFTDDVLPDARTMIIVSALALAGNIATLLILRRARSPEAHFEASWIFTANDVKANALVIVSAVVVAITNNPTADLVAGAAIFLIVANGARRILILAR